MSSDMYQTAYIPGAETRDWKTPRDITPPGKSSSDLSPKIAPVGGPESDHYTAHAITPMEYVKGMGRDEYRGACVLNVIKYVTRFHLKGKPAEDLQKARWYLDQLIEAQAEWDRDSTEN